jgi:tryptophan-rich sensory protein
VRWWLPGLALTGLLFASLGGEIRPAALLEWYLGLRRPWWQPPDWAVPLVWAGLFALMWIAVRRALAGSSADRPTRGILVATTANLFLNGLWAVLFFLHRRPDWAMPEAVLLWSSIVWLMIACGRRDRGSAWLLLPYLVWVGFAVLLNLALVRLNAPFP